MHSSRRWLFPVVNCSGARGPRPRGPGPRGPGPRAPLSRPLKSSRITTNASISLRHFVIAQQLCVDWEGGGGGRGSPGSWSPPCQILTPVSVGAAWFWFEEQFQLTVLRDHKASATTDRRRPDTPTINHCGATSEAPPLVPQEGRVRGGDQRVWGRGRTGGLL